MEKGIFTTNDTWQETVSNCKDISIFKFSSFYTKLRNDFLIDLLFEIMDFVFNGGWRKPLISQIS